MLNPAMTETTGKQIALSYNDPQSPYYLNSFDHLGYIISLVILKRGQLWEVVTIGSQCPQIQK